MSQTPRHLREKYPTATEPPCPSCRVCRGAGEWLLPAAPGRAASIQPCLCLYVPAVQLELALRVLPRVFGAPGAGPS